MSKDKLAQVFHFDLYGKREEKYEFLNENSLESIDFTSIPNKAPMFFMVGKDFDLEEIYNNGIDLKMLFNLNIMGFQTHRDSFCIDFNRLSLKIKIEEFVTDHNSTEIISKKYEIKESSDFNIKKAQDGLKKLNLDNEIIKCLYRPFENANILFNRLVVDRPRSELITHAKNRDNILLGVGRQGMAVGDIEWCLAIVSRNPVDANVFRRGGVNLFPLYLYPETNAQLSIGESQTRVPNLNMEIVNKIAESLGLKFTPENASTPLSVTNNTNDPVSLSGVEDHNANQAPSLLDKALEASFCPIDILDYIYAVLHSPAYREKYKEFLKIDFPRVPYPKASPNLSKGEARKCFFDLVDLGRQLRELHLLESPEVENYITQYPIDGDNVVVKPIYMSLRGTKQSEIKEPQTENLQMTAISEEEELKHGSSALTNRLPQPDEKIGLRNDLDNLGKVYINETQYFDNVPEKAWNFYIGG
jgi:predicted helicase